MERPRNRDANEYSYRWGEALSKMRQHEPELLLGASNMNIADLIRRCYAHRHHRRQARREFRDYIDLMIDLLCDSGGPVPVVFAPQFKRLARDAGILPRKVGVK